MLDHPCLMQRINTSQIYCKHHWMCQCRCSKKDANHRGLDRCSEPGCHCFGWHTTGSQEALVPELSDRWDPGVTEEVGKCVHPDCHCPSKDPRDGHSPVERLHSTAGHWQADPSAGTVCSESLACGRVEASYTSTKPSQRVLRVASVTSAQP